MWNVECGITKSIGASSDDRTSGIGESEHASGLVEAFTDRIILRFAEDLVLKMIPHEHKLCVPTGYYQC